MSVSITHDTTPSKSRRNRITHQNEQCLFVRFWDKRRLQLEKRLLDKFVKEYANQVKKIIVFQEKDRCYGKIVFETISDAKMAVQQLQGHEVFHVSEWKTSDKTNGEPFPACSNQSSPKAETVSRKCRSQLPQSGGVKCLQPKTKTKCEPLHSEDLEDTMESFQGMSMPSSSKLVKVEIIKEPLPCSTELMVYCNHKFNHFTTLWESIGPVEVTQRGGVVYLKGSLVDVNTATNKVLGHPLLKKLSMEFINTNGDPRKIQKKVSRHFFQVDVIYASSNNRKALLCSKNISEFRAAKKLLEMSCNMALLIPFCPTFFQLVNYEWIDTICRMKIPPPQQYSFLYHRTNITLIRQPK